jgi:hypothetical protein
MILVFLLVFQVTSSTFESCEVPHSVGRVHRSDGVQTSESVAINLWHVVAT